MYFLLKVNIQQKKIISVVAIVFVKKGKLLMILLLREASQQ